MGPSFRDAGGNQNADRNQLATAFWQTQAIHLALSWSSLPSYEGLCGEMRYDDVAVHGRRATMRKRCGTLGKHHAALHKPERSSSM